MKLSIYTIEFNDYMYIDALFNSILNNIQYFKRNLTYTDDSVEFIVLDTNGIYNNAPPDYIKFKIDNVFKNEIDDRFSVKYFKDDDYGVLYARLSAIKKCTGDYIITIDADDNFVDEKSLYNIYSDIKNNYFPDICRFRSNTTFVKDNARLIPDFSTSEKISTSDRAIYIKNGFKAYNIVQKTLLENSECCKSVLLHENVIKRKVYENAISELESLGINLNIYFTEDILLMFYILKNSLSIYSSDNIVYNHNLLSDSESNCDPNKAYSKPNRRICGYDKARIIFNTIEHDKDYFFNANVLNNSIIFFISKFMLIDLFAYRFYIFEPNPLHPLLLNYYCDKCKKVYGEKIWNYLISNSSNDIDILARKIEIGEIVLNKYSEEWK